MNSQRLSHGCGCGCSHELALLLYLNYIENLSLATVSTLAVGIYDAKTASSMGLMFMLGKVVLFWFRLIYSSFYDRKDGLKGKLKKAGEFLCFIGLIFNTALFANRIVKSYLNKWSWLVDCLLMGIFIFSLFWKAQARPKLRYRRNRFMENSIYNLKASKRLLI